MNTIYGDIAARTRGNVYIGVVGPVRTGKSTLVKRIMEKMVIPCIEEPHRRERAGRSGGSIPGRGLEIQGTADRFRGVYGEGRCGS